jgi:hypothetical protein
MGRPCDWWRRASGEAGGGCLMAQDKIDKTDKPVATLATSATREASIDFVRGMMRNVRRNPQDKSVHAFRSQIELCAVFPEEEEGKIYDTPRVYDITFNVDKLSELVSQYEQDSNPYALQVLLTIFENALLFSRPIPEPMVDLVRKWVRGKGPKKKKASNPEFLSRDASLVSAILYLWKHAGILPRSSDDKKPSDEKHPETGCEIAVRIWNEGGRSFVTLNAAIDAWKAYRSDCGGDSSVE